MIRLDPTAATAFDGLQTLAAMAAADHPDLSAWVATAAARLALGLPADRAMGLDPQSLASGRLRERDRHLRLAWHAVSPDPGLSGRARALALLQAVHRFQGSLWPRIRGRSEPPPGLTEVQRALFFALQAGGGRLPRFRRILDLCNTRPD